jgi:hypothetical protein
MPFSGTQGAAVLTLRVRDENNVGLQLLEVIADIYNSESVLKQTVVLSSSPATLQELQDSEGYYYQIDFDASDPVDWPGALLRVEWTVTEPGSPSPSPATQTFSKMYTFYPVETQTSSRTVLSWKPVNSASLRGYTIEFKYLEDLDYTYLSFSPYPCFIDETSYTPTQRNRVLYRVMTSLWNPDGDPSPSDGEIVANIAAWQTDKELCLVTGTVTFPTGQPDDYPYPRFLVHHSQAPSNVENHFMISSSEIVAPTNNFGQFAIPLIQGTLVTAEIPSIGYSRKFIVPAQAHVRLVDLDTSLIELYRAE